MRRMGLGLFAMAALAVASNSAFAGHTAAEVLMFLGDGIVNPTGGESASFTPLDGPAADALAGDVVRFPVYLQAVAGDQTNTQVAFYAYDTWATHANLLSGVAVTRIPFGTGAGSSGGPGDGAAGPLTLGLETTSRTSVNTFEGIGALPEAIMISDGAVHVGWIDYTIGAGAMDGDSIDVYLGVGSNAFGLVDPGAITVAFGWDEAGGQSFSGGRNSYRLQNPAVDVIGTSAGHISTLADATINIIPEPATMGLLGLGLLAIRRRRA